MNDPKQKKRAGVPPDRAKPQVNCAFDEEVLIEKLVPNPRNPNQHPESQVRLLATRVQLSHQAQDLKRQHRLPAIDRTREAEIAHRYERQWRGAGVVARSILNLCHED